MDGDEADFITNNSSIKIKNPISTDLNTMRPSTFPNLLSTINSNVSRLYMSGKLFEVGPNFHNINDDGQEMVASGIQYGYLILYLGTMKKDLQMFMMLRVMFFMFWNSLMFRLKTFNMKYYKIRYIIQVNLLN